MPNRHQALVIKLISVGLSHDLSLLEQIKYTKEGATTKYTEVDFKAVYNKMFQALLLLGYIIKDYELRRLCIQAANVCEPQQKFSKDILTFLPECDSERVQYAPEMAEAIVHLREQLETFQSAIRMNICLAETWTKASILCYENLDFLARRKFLSEDLAPLEYPGVEKHLKRTRRQSNEEAEEVEQKPLNSAAILGDSKVFAVDISRRLKLIRNPFRSQVKLNYPTAETIDAVIVAQLVNSPNFETDDAARIFIRLADDVCLEKSKQYVLFWFWIDKEQQKNNGNNLYFDYNMEMTGPGDCSVSTMYQEGKVRVYDLCCQGLSIFDIENVMLYTVAEKKKLYMNNEFAFFNKNQNVDVTKSQSQSALNYLFCRCFPENNRLMRVVNTGFTNTGMLEFCLDNYHFQATPGTFKYIKKNRPDENSELNGSQEEDDSQQKAIGTSESSKSSVQTSREIAKIVPKSSPKSVPKSMPKIWKKDRPTETLGAEETFDASEELLGVFKSLETNLTRVCHAPVVIDINQMCDKSSPHKVTLTMNYKMQVPVKLQKRRNQRMCPMTSDEFEVPARIHSYLAIVTEITDSIHYDVNNDNPYIRSKSQIKLTGSLALDHVSHIIKNIDLEVSVKGIKSKIKLSMRGGSRALSKSMKAVTSHDSDHSSPRKSFSASQSFSSPPMNGTVSSTVSSQQEPATNGVPNDTQNMAESSYQDFNSTVNSSQMQESFQGIELYNTQIPIKDEPMTVDQSQAYQELQEHYSNSYDNHAAYQEAPYQEHNGSVHQYMAPSDQYSHVASYDQQQAPQHNPDPVQLNALNAYQPHSQFPISHERVKTEPGADVYQMVHHKSVAVQQEPVTIHHEQIVIKQEPVEVQHEPVSTPSEPIAVEHEAIAVQHEPVGQPTSVITSALRTSATTPKKVKIIEIEYVSPKKFDGDPDEPQFMKLEMTNGHSNQNVIRESAQTCPDAHESVQNYKDVSQNVQSYKDTQIKEEIFDRNSGLEASSAVGMLVDFEEEIGSGVPVRKPDFYMNTEKVPEQTPPTSPPPLHYPELSIFRARGPKFNQHERKIESKVEPIINTPQLDLSADRILSTTPPSDVIDLTEDVEFVEDRDPFQASRPRPGPKSRTQPRESVTAGGFPFVSCQTTVFSDKLSKIRNQATIKCPSNGVKRPRLSSEELRSHYKIRNSDVRLVDVFDNLNTGTLMANMTMNATVVNVNQPNVGP